MELKWGYVSNVELTLKKICPLCEAIKTEPLLYNDDKCVVIDTKTLKGHQRRLMSVYFAHSKYDGYLENTLVSPLIGVGRAAFSYATKFVIMAPDFATIKDHAHLVATDLDPKSEDFDQILKTRWLRVVDV